MLYKYFKRDGIKKRVIVNKRITIAVNFLESLGVVLSNLGCSHSVIIKEVGPLGSGLFFLNKVSFQTIQKAPNQNLIFVVSNFQLIGLLLQPFVE